MVEEQQQLKNLLNGMKGHTLSSENQYTRLFYKKLGPSLCTESFFPFCDLEYLKFRDSFFTCVQSPLAKLAYMSI